MVEFHNQTEYQLNAREFCDLVEYVLKDQQVSTKVECSIVIVDLATIAELNEKWRGNQGPTDVLSFPIDELRPGLDLSRLENPVLGDIYLCPEYAQKEADRQGHSLEDELLLLTAHSVLHLLGFDHMDPDERALMFDLQRELLLKFLATQSK
jgi:probable rRNA maturation factor